MPHESCCMLLPLGSKGFFFFTQNWPWYCSGNRMDILAGDLGVFSEHSLSGFIHGILLFYLLNLSQWGSRKRTVRVSIPEPFNQVQRANWKASLWLRMEISQLSVWSPNTNFKAEKQALASCCLLPREVNSKF